MKDIKRLFLEIRFEIFKIIALNGFLKATIVFLALHLPLALFGVTKSFRFTTHIIGFISLLYLVGAVIAQFRQISYKELEEREPVLEDILTTAADTIDQENVMVRAMWRDLADRVKQIRPVMFFEPAKILLWFFIIIGLAVFTTLAPTLRYELARNNITTDSFSFELDIPFLKDSDDYSGSGLEAAELVEDESIFGDRAVIILGDEELSFEISQDFSGIDFDSAQDALGTEFDEDEEFSEVFIPKAAAFDIKKQSANNKQQKEWIKNYFDALES